MINIKLVFFQVLHSNNFNIYKRSNVNNSEKINTKYPLSSGKE